MNNPPLPTALPSAPAAPPSIDDLGVRGCLYLAALLTAQDRRLPIAPTLRASLAVVTLLREHGLVEVPWPDQRWSVPADAEETPIEHLQWRYRWATYMRTGLLGALEDFLQAVPRDDYGLALRLQLWEELALAESERYFEQQLAKNRFDPAWARDLAFIHRDMQPQLSIGQWRYCSWAAVRQGASIAYRQQTPDLAPIREAIFSQIRKRAGHLGAGTWNNCAFPPNHPLPDSALGRLFSVQMARLGTVFWTEVPSLEALVFKSGQTA